MRRGRLAGGLVHGWLVLAAVAAVFWGSVLPTAAGAASRRVSVSAVVPGVVLAGAKVRVSGIVRGSAQSVMLQVKRPGEWTKVSGGRTRRRGRFLLAWRTPRDAGRVVVRVVAVRRGRIVGGSRGVVVSVSAGRFPSKKLLVVARSAAVAGLPSPGHAGSVVFRGASTVKPGQVLALPYSPSTPDGFLGRVLATGSQGSETVLQTQPATLEQAGADGTLDLATFHQVGAGAASERSTGRIASGEVFNHDLRKQIECSSGGSASLIGSVAMSLTPAMHASFSLLGGLRSADFSLTGAASASVAAHVEANSGCALKSTALLAEPLHIATFTGSIGPIPVVIVLQGQVFVDAKLSAEAKLTSSISASTEITGGVRYERGTGFSPIFNGPNANLTFTPPTITGNAQAQANLEPTLQLLLYGAAGTQLGVKTGLAFNADTTKNPWWTLDAPLSVEASLTAPSLGKDSGTLTLYDHTFDIAHAKGPYGGAVALLPCAEFDPSAVRTVFRLVAKPDHCTEYRDNMPIHAAENLLTSIQWHNWGASATTATATATWHYCGMGTCVYRPARLSAYHKQFACGHQVYTELLMVVPPYEFRGEYLHGFQDVFHLPGCGGTLRLSPTYRRSAGAPSESAAALSPANSPHPRQAGLPLTKLSRGAM